MMKKGIYAILTALTVFALVLTGCPDGGGNSGTTTTEKWKITYDANGGSGTQKTDEVEKGKTFTLPTTTTITPPGGKSFDGWSTTATGDKITSIKPTEDTKLFAIWKEGTGPGPGPNEDPLARAEKVTLANGWYAIYRFVLPAGKTFADYQGMSAEYMFEEADLAVACGRNGRVMGPFEPSDFEFIVGTGTAEGNIAAVAGFGNGKNAPYILDGGKLGNTGPGTLVEELSKVGIDAVGGEWFTYDQYIIDGSKKNGDYPVSRLEALMASGGTLYFGLGLPGNVDNNANTYYIRDVKLIGYEAADTVTATALYFEKDGKKYPAYNGYAATSGTAGIAEADRAVASEEFKFPSSVIPAGVEKVTLANGWYAIYKFTLPAGKTFADYEGMSADYMFEEADLAVACGRNGRVMGPFVAGDFEFIVGTGTAEGNIAAVAGFGNGKNAPYILDGGKLGNTGPGTLVEELSKIGIDAVGGEWFTYDQYIIDGSKKNGDYPASRLEALMASSGTLYFGLGLPGNVDNNANTYYIRNIKLIGYEAADTVFGTPLYLDQEVDEEDEDPPATLLTNVPAYNGYAATSGTAGIAEADRRPVFLDK